jgi:hypothetical protein
MSVQNFLELIPGELNQTQSDKVKKAFFPYLNLLPGETWEDVTLDMVKEDLLGYIRGRVKAIDMQETQINYTDMT